MNKRKVDPITLSVVRGVLETTQREMTLALEQTARSSVFNLAHDYSTALFNHTPEMILQGQDIPIHLGSLIPAMKSVAQFFEGDIHEGDLILHNDPAYGGSHIIDTCMYYPVFYQGELVFWTVCKGHLTDIGGPVPAGYNPNATEIYAEGLRIPPVKLWDRGVPRHDVMNLLLTNMRARRDQEGDFNALIGACQVGARNLKNLMDKYGKDVVQDCVAELLDMAEAHMRKLISEVPDGTYSGTAILEDAGHGLGDFEITATLTVAGDGCHIAISSPPQVPYFINSYEGNSYSGVYLGLMMFAQLPPPYNEGLYRCVKTDMGPKGTLCNAQSPAPHMNCTTTPMETLTDAVPAGLRASGTGQGFGQLGPREWLQHRRLGQTSQRGICHDGSCFDHLGGGGHGDAGWLACLRAGMLFRRAAFGRYRDARTQLSDHYSRIRADGRFRRRGATPRRIGHPLGGRTAGFADDADHLRGRTADTGDGCGGRALGACPAQGRSA